MSERLWRSLLWVAAALLVAFGLPSFVAPVWASGEFPWTVGPFLAQTIGGWSVGTAAIAALAAYFGRPRFVYALVVYCGLFGLFELIVVIGFLDKLQVGKVLTYPYLGGLACLIAAAAVFAVGWWLQSRPATAASGDRAALWHRALALAVGGFVTVLAVGTLFAGPNGATARGEVFPEPMGLFSIRAFSAFLFAIALSMASLLPARDSAPYFALALAGLCLIVPITLPALLNLSLFTFDRPGTMVYLIAYIAVGVVLAAAISYRQLRRRELSSPDAA